VPTAIQVSNVLASGTPTATTGGLTIGYGIVTRIMQ
jgi:hypothetical protein